MEADTPVARESSVRVDLAVERAGDIRVLVWCLLGAVVADVALRSGLANVSGVALAVVVAAAMLSSGRMQNAQARALAVVAPLFAVWLALRESPWLLIPDVAATAALFALAASFARGGSVLDVSLPQLLGRAVAGLEHGIAAPAFALAPVRRGVKDHGLGRRLRPFVRGTLLAIPALLLLGGLLASADPVFARFFRVSADPGDLVVHAVVLTFGAWAVAGLFRVASASRPVATITGSARLSAPEATAVLGGVVALYALFAVAQLVALSGAGRRILSTAGLTYAEYARSGFFQLVAVAAITLALLLVLRAATRLESPRARRVFLVLSEAAVGLTLVIVVVAIRRLLLYDDAFGLTMLRLYVIVAAFCIGVVFVLLGASLAGVARRRQWFLPAALATGMVALLVLNVVNPEAIVVRRNIDRAAAGERLDVPYLLSLSQDAVPAIVGGYDRVDPEGKAGIHRELCLIGHRPLDGLAALNASDAAARDAIRELCSRAGSTPTR